MTTALLSLTQSLSVPFSTCFSRSLSVPASHLLLMSLFPCAWSCHPRLNIHLAVFCVVPLPAINSHCLGIWVCMCVCVCVSIFMLSVLVGMCSEEQCLWLDYSVFDQLPICNLLDCLAFFTADCKIRLLPLHLKPLASKLRQQVLTWYIHYDVTCLCKRPLTYPLS